MSASNQATINIENATASFNKQHEASESYDSLGPIKEKKDFDNKAFELEDIDITNGKKNPFDRTERPGSMISVKSNASTTSRSSVNCTTGRMRCPNMRLKKFFSYKPIENDPKNPSNSVVSAPNETGFTKAIEEVQKLVLPDKYGNFVGAWLLIEISTWDFHREKVVMLCDKAVFIVSYDFINSKISDYEIIALADLVRIKFGNLKYPDNTWMPGYVYGAVRLLWGEEQMGFLAKWSIFENSQYKTFTSHQILYNEKEKETQFWNCDEFINSLEMVVKKLPECSKVQFNEEPVEIENKIGFGSVLYNQNWLGFQLDRNGLNF